MTCTADNTAVHVEWSKIYTDCVEDSYSVQYNFSVLWEEHESTSSSSSVNDGNIFTIPSEDFVPATLYFITVSTDTLELTDTCSLTTEEASKLMQE